MSSVNNGIISVKKPEPLNAAASLSPSTLKPNKDPLTNSMFSILPFKSLLILYSVSLGFNSREWGLPTIFLAISPVLSNLPV